MKNHLHSYPLLFSLLFLCFAHFSFSQKGIQIPDFHGKEVKDVAKNQLEQRFEKYEVFQIPTKALSRSVQGKSTTQFELRLNNNRNWKMTLFESNLYGENYVTRVMTENGVVTAPRAENAVFKGFLNDNRDNEIRLTIAEGFIFGFVTDGEKRYYVEPLKHHDKMANPDHFVLYTVEDIIPLEDAFCGVEDIQQLEEDIDHAHTQHKSADDLACLEMELAQAADFGMFQRYGSVANLNLYMDGIMNATAANYDDEFFEQIVILVSERYIVACDGCDPWTSSGDYNAIFPDFQSWALGPNGFTAPHDLRCLWTTRDIGNGGPGTAVGVANGFGLVCEINGNTIYEDFSSLFFEMQLMSTHELGHLFGAFHNFETSSTTCQVGSLPRGPLIMDPQVSPATTWSTGSEPCVFNGGSIPSINAHVATRTCMSACVGVVCENTFVDGVDVTNTSSGTIDLIWNVSTTNYEVRARVYGTSAWTYTNSTTATNETISGLMCNTEYEVQVRADCGGGLYGPPTTASVRTTGLNIDNLNIINCGGGVYDLEIIIDTDNAAAGGAFDITIGGNVFPQTYDGSNPQTVIFPGLPTDGTDGVNVTVGDANCSQTATYDSPPLECTCTTIQAENFDACSLPAGWTNNALGTSSADWNFGFVAGGVNTPVGNIDGTCMAYFDDDAFDGDGGEAMELISPPVDLTDFQNINLEFDYNFWIADGSVFQVDVFDGVSWVNVLTETSPACGPWGTCTIPHAIIPIDNYINQNFQVRFIFDDLGNWEWIVAIDNFSICGFTTECIALNPNFTLCNGDEFSYDLTQQDLFVNPLGENVTWFDGQPASGTATDLSPATAVDLTMVNDLWALVSTADTCLAETQVSYVLSPQLTITSTTDTICAGGAAELCVEANLPAMLIDWIDDAGNTISTTNCVTVMPSVTTTYNVVYFDSEGCSDAASKNIIVSTAASPPDTLDVGICEQEGLMSFDLTQYDDNFGGGTMGTPTATVDWYDGQPSIGGTDITPTADVADLTGMPSIWALITDLITNCTQEVLLNYGVDTTPQITCPADVVTNSDPDTCGAFVALPLAVVMDDSLTIGSSPTQTIQLDFSGDEFLTFNFDATNIDPTQPVGVDLTIVGNLSTGFVNFSDETFDLGALGAVDCIPNTASFSYTSAQIAPMLTDGVFVMNADVTGTSAATCPDNYVLITITYTPIFADTYLTVTNDFNLGGVDASGFYPPGTTVVTYIATDACGNSDTCAINVTVNQDFVQGDDFFFTACGDFMDFDVTQFSAQFGNGMGTPTNLIWYDGQPSMGGTNITANADSLDLTNMPDVWVQITDLITGCPTEINLMYELDAPPQVTCPADINVNSDMGICGATLTIPPIVVMDDSITPFPDDQMLFVDYTFDGETLQFDFDGTNIDQTQAATLTITVSGDIGLSSEYYDIFDENGNFFAQLGNGGFTDCVSETTTFTIPVADLTAYLADNVMTFTATGTTAVNPFCGLDGVEMNLNYTPLSVQYLSITNDYTSGGADASGFYPAGTTTVTYTATDGCGNIGTCSIDVNVSPGTTTGFFEILADADTLCTGGVAELCLDIPPAVPDGLYALSAFNQVFSDIALYSADLATNTLIIDGTYTGPDIGETTYGFDLNPVDNMVYLLARVNASNANRQLFTVDLVTGAITNIGGQVISAAGNPNPQAITFDAVGNLYATFNGGELHQINYSTNPVTTTLLATGIPQSGAVGLTYDFDNDRLLYATGTGTVSLYEININTYVPNLLTTFSTAFGCAGQGIEYVGNGIVYGASAVACNEIYALDINTGNSTTLLSPTGSFAQIKDLMFVPSLADGDIVWMDDAGNQIDTTQCITVMPSMTTTYTATYNLPNGCVDVSNITIATTGTNLSPTTFGVGICESEDITAFDLTQYNQGITINQNEIVTWYIGQPSMGGTDITATANATDLSTMPDIWALTINSITNCMQEVDVMYQIDNSPTITCPAAITVNNDPDTCGAFISIPLATAMDDNINPLPDVISLRLDYFDDSQPLLFDFDGTNIDPNQPITVTVIAVGDLDSSVEYYEIFDENGTSLTLLNGVSNCTENIFTYTIPVGDVAAFLADNIISFSAAPTTAVDLLCPENYVEIELAYGSFAPQFTSISNDYNDGGADASGFYLPGTTTVTYVAIDGCGNTDTCSVDITVNQEITQESDLFVTACGDFMNFDLTQFNFNFGSGMGTPTNVNIDWYNGQPSMNGMNITDMADSTDLTNIPDIWALLTDVITGCPSEVNLMYEFDFPPQITCPTAVTVNADAGVCGANVTIPLATATDDGVSPILQGQTIYTEFFVSGPTLQFDFSTTNIDLTQPATLTVTAFADMGDFSEAFDIFDENGNLVLQLGNNVFTDCQSETGTFTISVADLALFAADNVITFTAIGTPNVDAFCFPSAVEMILDYIPLTPQVAIITNDYNDAGANASGFYPSGTTIVTYTATDGCGNTDTCTVAVTVIQPPITGSSYFGVFCGDPLATDITQFDIELINNPGDIVLWFDGQPSAGGIDITTMATATDISGTPDLWVQVIDEITGCIEERDILYFVDTPPTLTCPANITVDADPGVCGANVTIPAVIVMDDNITPLPDGQTFFVEHTQDFQVLQFDFDGTNVDVSQPAALSITVYGDLGSSNEYFDIFDENGVIFVSQLGNNTFTDCESETITFTLPAVVLANYLADNVMTFTASAPTTVDFICNPAGVEMSLSYTPLTQQFTTISNDYNNGGADASDFYPSGTTTVTYTAIDGCGNVGTCSVDITVDQVPLPATVEADIDTICIGQSTEICLLDGNFGEGQLFGLNYNGTWIGGVFNVSDNLDMITEDSNFVVPPIQSPAPLSGTYYAIDYNPIDGLYYMLANNPTGGINLYSVNLTTGATVDLGFISDEITSFARIMTFDSAGNLYIGNIDTNITPPVTNIEFIPAGMLTNPIMPTVIASVPFSGFIGMTYNFDSNTLYYSEGSTQLYELDLSGNIINGPIGFTSPTGCTEEAIEYMGNGILYGGACNQIYQIDPATGNTGPVLAAHNGDFNDLMFVPSTEITWTDNSGNVVATGTETCIEVMPDVTTTYTANYTAGGDCIYEGSITVTVLDLNMNDAVTITDPGSTCVAGQLLDFTGSPDGGVFTSTAAAGFSSDGVNTATLNPAEVGVGMYDITYTYTNAIGCVGHATVTIEIYDEPVIMVSSNSPVCADESLQLVETAGMAVAWSWTSDGTATFDDATAQSPSASGASDGETFTVTITDINGCTATSSITAEILSLPQANDPQLLFCPNEDISNVNLLAENTNVNPNATPTSVTWYDGDPDNGGILISPADDVDLNVVNDLWALMTDDNGCSSPVDVGIFFYPGMTFAPTIEVPTCADEDGGSITLNISGGLAPYDYTWASEDGTASGTGDIVNDLTIGSYNITVTDANGCSETTVVDIAEESCFFTITNSFFASDPCRCNGDQSENGADDGTFSEVVTVNGAPGLIIRAAPNSTGLSTGAPVDFYEALAGRYRLEFTHADRVGYVIYIEFSEDGGQTFLPATDENGMQLVISNVCAYPVLGFIPSLMEFCETQAEFTIDAQEISPDVDFIDIPGFPAIAINNGFQIPAPITFDPAGLGGSTYTFTAFYNHQSGTGMGGTLAAPAVALNVCPTFIRVNVPISDEPVGEAICGPGEQANEAIIDIDPMEDYPTVENLMYRLNNGPFQISDKFTVNETETYALTIMDMETACSYEFEVSCFISLPIELTGFEAICNDGEYVLEWKTATEEDVLEFVIERSTNGTDFTQLDKVTAVGNSTTTQTYSYRDDTAQAGRYYYRLRIVEADGKETLSRIEAAACLKGVFDIVDVFPNPTDHELTILFETTNADAINFKLTDVLGRTIMEENITPDIGLNTKVIDLSQLSSAVYFVVMDDGRAVRKVLRK